MEKTGQRIEDFDANINETDIRQALDNNAAAIASQAYQFGLPAFLNMRQLTEFIQARQYMKPDELPLGGWILVRTLADPSTTNNAPNNDTLYGASYVLLDQQGPVVLTVPEISDRYYSVELLDAYFNNFAVISSRQYGNSGGKFLIVPPSWDDEEPAGYTAILRSPTPYIALFQRIFINNDSEYDQVHAMQDAITLKPLDGDGFAAVDLTNYEVQNMRQTTDPIKFFEYVNSYTAINRPPKSDDGLVALFKTVGLGPDAPVTINQRYIQPIIEGARQAQKTINARISSGPFKNGWRVPDPLIGREGPHILSRAVGQLTQIGSFVPEEAMYFFANKDSNNELLSGSCEYKLMFAKDGLPPINKTGFWSLTMYNQKWLLSENELNRYIIRPTSTGLKYGQDGSLTIYIQHNRPADSSQFDNWLPAPDGLFTVALRAYHPQPITVSGEWFPPAIEKLAQS